MTTLFVDSYFYFAASNPNDPGHVKAAQYVATFLGTLVTTNWVLTEVADGMARSSRWRAWFTNFYADLLLDPSTRIIPFSQDLFRAGLDLYGRRPDKAWSLTDCVSFEVMEREGITDALTADHHFEQAGFVALLK